MKGGGRLNHYPWYYPRIPDIKSAFLFKEFLKERNRRQESPWLSVDFIPVSVTHMCYLGAFNILLV